MDNMNKAVGPGSLKLIQDLEGCELPAGKDGSEIQDDRVRSVVCELMSEMLDNPDTCGIYPTSEFMWRTEQFILNAISEAQDEVAQSKDEQIVELRKKRDFTYCAYCNEQFPCDAERDTGAISKHIAECPDHPMRGVEAERNDLSCANTKQRAVIGDLSGQVDELHQKLLAHAQCEHPHEYAELVEVLKRESDLKEKLGYAEDDKVRLRADIQELKAEVTSKSEDWTSAVSISVGKDKTIKELKAARDTALENNRLLVADYGKQADKLRAEVSRLNEKWRHYEREYINPTFEWAKELGIDLEQMVLDNPGKNCVQLLVMYLKDEVQEHKDNYLTACSTVAKVHAAAVGKVTCPKRGVVEDVEDVRLRVEDLTERVRHLKHVIQNGGDEPDGSCHCAICQEKI